MTNSEEANLLSDLIDKYAILDELENKKVYTKEDKDNLRIVYLFINGIVNDILYRITYDKYNYDYLSFYSKIINKLRGKNFNNLLIKHNCNLNYYKKIVNDINEVKLDIENRSIDDIRLTLNLLCFTYAAFDTQMIVDERNMKDCEYITDDDIKLIDYKNDVAKNYGALKYSNMLHNKNYKIK